MNKADSLKIWKPAYEFRKEESWSGILYKEPAGKHLLKKGFQVAEEFHPLEHDILWEKDIAVEMRDGVKIYTDVYRPTTDEKVPAIIVWSPYGKNSGNGDRYKNIFRQLGIDMKCVSGLQKWEGPDPDYWVGHGYAILHPDTRGIGKSEGDITMVGTQEGRDGYDLVEWAAKQEWCNGKVSFAGTSYLTFSQWFIGAECPPHLACLQPSEGFTDAFRDLCRRGGMPDFVFARGLQTNHQGNQRREDVYEECQKYPFITNDLWQDKIAGLENINVPVYVVASYSNVLHTDGTFRGWRGVKSKDKWLRIHDNLEWPDFYNPKYIEDRRRFYDHFLKGIDNGWENTPRVRYSLHDMEGGNRVDLPATEFPPVGTEYKKLYLNGVTRRLDAEPPATDTPAVYDTEGGVFNRASFHLTFNHDTSFIGYPKVKLYLEADGADDMDLFVYVQKLDRQGTLRYQYTFPCRDARSLDMLEPAGGLLKYVGSYGRLRVSRRHLDPKLSTDIIPVLSEDREEKLSKGQIVEVEIPLAPIGMTFYEGETLRLHICGDNPNGGYYPNTFYKPDNHGRHIIHCGGKYQSYLQIGVLQ